MEHMELDIAAEVANVKKIPVVPAILEVICRTTGMGFAVVARVTTEKWVACEVRDEVKFGLMAGGELKLDTTICHEIRQSGDPVIIDHVSEDETYHNHHTPIMYGLQSYISVPIVVQDGRFFGTLCAIDPKPSMLNNTEIVGMFKTYANLLSFYISAAELPLSGGSRPVEDRIMTEIKSMLDKIPADGHAAGSKQEEPVRDKGIRYSAVIKESTLRIQVLLNELSEAMKQK